MSIKISSLSGATTEEISKIEQALALANQVMGSDAFKVAVMTATFTSTNFDRVTIWTALTQTNYPISLSVVTPPWWKRWFSREVAHENTDGSVVLDRNKLCNEDIPSLANTLAHETCHSAGFVHSSAKDYQSVPYQVGSIVEQLARDQANQ